MGHVGHTTGSGDRRNAKGQNRAPGSMPKEAREMAELKELIELQIEFKDLKKKPNSANHTQI